MLTLEARKTPIISTIIFMPEQEQQLFFFFLSPIHSLSSPALPGFSTDSAQLEHFISQAEKSPLMILYVFSVLFITTLTAGVKRETSAEKKNLPRLPSGKVKLKLERGITWTKAPQGREWE